VIWRVELEGDDVSDGHIGQFCGFEVKTACTGFDHMDPDFGGGSLRGDR
jgi:hypothetical protein